MFSTYRRNKSFSGHQSWNSLFQWACYGLVYSNVVLEDLQAVTKVVRLVRAGKEQMEPLAKRSRHVGGRQTTTFTRNCLQEIQMVQNQYTHEYIYCTYVVLLALGQHTYMCLIITEGCWQSMICLCSAGHEKIEHFEFTDLCYLKYLDYCNYGVQLKFFRKEILLSQCLQHLIDSSVSFHINTWSWGNSTVIASWAHFCIQICQQLLI